jgi:hypothetical protein
LGYPNTILLGELYWGTAGDALRASIFSLALGPQNLRAGPGPWPWLSMPTKIQSIFPGEKQKKDPAGARDYLGPVFFFRGTVFFLVKKVAADGCPFVAWIMFLIFGLYDEE